SMSFRSSERRCFKVKASACNDIEAVRGLVGFLQSDGTQDRELSTAVDADIPTVTVVMNNGCWGAEKAYQRDFFNGRYIGADVSSPDFAKAAELYGAKGFSAERLSDVAPAVEAALTCGKPAVVDVAVDPAALYSFRRDSFKHRGG
ncbi:MAG: thiamine pyrophosphate-dependent enzyme, partial [Pseudomonadota bacterium]